MATWKITPKFKKSIVERNYWTTTDKSIVNEVCWRSGEFTIETEGDDPPVIDEDTNLFDYDLDDWSTDDGCWEDNAFTGFTEEEEEEMEEFLSENSIFDLDEKGWVCDETELYITCEVDIERVE